MVTGSDKVELEAIIAQLEWARVGFTTDPRGANFKEAVMAFDHGLERLKGLVP
jgi:uncharacterized membrane-anchored protein